MNNNWKKSNSSATICKIFTDSDGRNILFQVALTDISANTNIDLDKLARDTLGKRHQEKVDRYRFTGSHFEPE